MSLSPKESRIEREANAWVIRHDRGLSASEQDDFFEWLAADPRHGVAFEECRHTWSDFNLMEEWRPQHAAEPNPDLLAEKPRRRSWSDLIKWGSMAAAIMATTVWITLRFTDRPTSPPASSHGERLAFYHLPDGSEVDINGVADYDVSFSPHERRIVLRSGEMFFTVAQDLDRPFIVATPGAQVRALGTAFNVRIERDSVAVLVTEGKVAVEVSDNFSPTESASVPSSVSVEAGRLLVSRFNTPSTEWTSRILPRDEADLILEWKPVILEFDSVTLAEAVAVFNSYNQVEVTIGTESLRTMPIIATFRSNNVAGFVRLLEVTAGVRAERRNNQIVLWRD